MALLLYLGACGRIGFAPVDGTGGSADAAHDSLVADACAFGGWGPNRFVNELNTNVDEVGGQISADGLAYYFATGAIGAWDLAVARRPDRSSPFGPITMLTTLSSSAGDSGPSPTLDELELYFDSDRSGRPCIYVSTRSTTASPWSAPAVVGALCTGAGSTGAFVSADGLRLYYGTTEVDNGWGSLRVSTRATRTDTFAAGVPVPGIPTASASMSRGFPVLSSDEHTIYYELWNGTFARLTTSERADGVAVFAGEQPVSIMAPSAESDPSITADGTELWFSTFSGDGDVFVASRSCL